ncbi:MAG: hypothetical protein RR601_06305, partial [Erysipelotrichales bacterium]
ENIINDLKKPEEMFSSYEELKKEVLKNRKILRRLDTNLVEYLGFRRISLFDKICFYIKK